MKKMERNFEIFRKSCLKDGLCPLSRVGKTLKVLWQWGFSHPITAEITPCTPNPQLCPKIQLYNLF